MKVRTAYEKGDRVRFLSHLDVARVIQIAVNRAGWPVEMSQGFSPRPKLSFYAPLPAGTAGMEEYFDADLRSPRGLSGLAKGLSESLPNGFCLREVKGLPDKEGSLENKIAASIYAVDLLGVEPRALSQALRRFLDEETVTFDVVRPNETKKVDVRHFLLEVGEVRDLGEGRTAVDMMVKHEEGRTARPQWILSSLRAFGLELDPREAIIDRRKIIFGK